MRLLLITPLLFIKVNFLFSQCTCGEIEKLRSDITTRLDKIEASLTKSEDTTEVSQLIKDKSSLEEKERNYIKSKKESDLEMEKLKKQISNLKTDSIESQRTRNSSRDLRKINIQSLISSLGQSGFETPQAILDAMENEIGSLESEGLNFQKERALIQDFKNKSAALKKGDEILNKKLDSIDQISAVIAEIQKVFQNPGSTLLKINDQKDQILKLLAGYEKNLKRLCDIKELVALKGMDAQEKREVFNSLGINDRELLGYGFILLKIDEFIKNPNQDSTLSIKGFVCE